MLPFGQMCQRNWDLTKEVDPEHIELFQQAMTYCPSNENNTYFKVHFIKNRELIEEICEYTDGPGPLIPKIDDPRQTQTLANLLVLFEKWDDHDFIRGEEYGIDDLKAYRDQCNAIGIAAGYLIMVAQLLGYKTGMNICFEPKNQESIKNLMDLNDIPQIMVGVGFGQDKVSPLRHHIDKTSRWGVYWGTKQPPIYSKIWE